MSIRLGFMPSYSVPNELNHTVALSVGRFVGQSVGHAQVENLEKKQKSLEMIQKYARMIPRCAIAPL